MRQVLASMDATFANFSVKQHVRTVSMEFARVVKLGFNLISMDFVFIATISS